ncbi:hypothetical protein D9M68_584650 [compost metagenome]
MSTSHNSLIEALEAADMVEIDDLYAWQFSLDKELLAQVSAGSASADSKDQPLLSIDCIDGSTRRQWQFSLAAVTAASFDSARESWSLSAGSEQHWIKCLAAISADNSDAALDDEN